MTLEQRSERSEGDSYATAEEKAQPGEGILSAKALRQKCITWHFQETVWG